jgi:hypothetical protein
VHEPFDCSANAGAEAEDPHGSPQLHQPASATFTAAALGAGADPSADPTIAPSIAQASSALTCAGHLAPSPA